MDRRPTSADPDRPNIRGKLRNLQLRNLRRQLGMERLWSRAVATGGNRWQMGGSGPPLKQAETVALGCDRLSRGPDGKEGVDGSSPSEGFQFRVARQEDLTRPVPSSYLDAHG